MNTHFTFRDESANGAKKMVQTEEDARQLTPITERVLGLKKYQDAITSLRTAVMASPVGLVNFVTGRESSEIIDSVMVSAFPPSTGLVFQGDLGGYGMDCSTWGDPDHCSSRLLSTLKGKVKYYGADDMKSIDSIKGKFKHGDEVVERFINPQQENSGGMFQPTASNATTPQQRLENHKKLNDSLVDIKKHLSSLDPVADRKERQHWINLMHFVEAELAQNDGPLPRFVTDHGMIQFDGTGFMNHEVHIGPLMRAIDNLSDAKKLNAAIDAAASQEVKKGRKPSTEVTSHERKMIANMLIKRVYDRLKDMKDVSKPDSKAHIDIILEVLDGGPEAISKKGKKLSAARDGFYRSLRSQHKLLILQNVTDSSLVQWPQGSRPGSCNDGNPVFAFRPLLKNEFVKPSQRGHDRCIIMVSQEPIDFTIDGVEVVPLTGGVSDQEAEALVKYFKSEWETNLREAGHDASSMRMRQGDSDKLKLLITGVSHEEAVRRLMNAYHMAFDSSNMILEGKKVVKAVLQLGNDYAESRAEGGSKGFSFITPGVGKDDYIYREDSDWGEFCNTVRAEVHTAMNLWDYEGDLREKERLAEEGGDVKVVRSVRKKIAAVNGRIHSLMEDIPHFLILYGEASCGKSSFAEMMADLLDFRLVDVDLTQARGMYVGQTEGQSRAMIEAWKNMSNVILRLDEVDGQMATDEDAARNSHNASVIKQLLAFFNDNIALLNARNIFVIATTNNPQLIRAQMMNRGVPYEVPLPLNKDGYTKFLVNAPSRLRKAYTKGFLWGEFSYKGTEFDIYEDEAAWNAVESIWADVDIDALASALDGKRVDFRNLIKLLRACFGALDRNLHSQQKRRLWVSDREEYKYRYPNDCNDGACPEPSEEGFDLSTENLCEVIDLTEIKTVRGFGTTADGQQSVMSFGVPKLERKLRTARQQKSGSADGQIDMLNTLFDNSAEVEEDVVVPA